MDLAIPACYRDRVRKVYVLDTNVLLHDPRAIHNFVDNDVVIPVHVIEEIDHFKKEMSERGRNARALTRFIDQLRQDGRSLQDGVALEGGGTLRVAVPEESLSFFNQPGVPAVDPISTDNRILRVALRERDRHDVPVIFVTMDTNLRIRADALGLRAENYEGARIAADETYSGMVELFAPSEVVDTLGGRKPISLSELEPTEGLYPNAGVILRDATRESHSALGRFDASRDAVVPLRVGRDGAWGVKPRNLEQSLALDLLLSDEVSLITLVGKAGTGKTLLAIAAGLRKIVDEGVFARLVVSRPVFPLGRDLGYLPGTVEEKLNPWMQPIFDNLEYIFTTGRRASMGRTYQELLAAGTIEVEPLTYIRGRTLPHQFMIVDEAQNLTPHEVKTIITRCGSETKIVLTGDPHQIDNPYVDAASNGLAIVAERFRGERLAGHMMLVKGERSELAERATELL